MDEQTLRDKLFSLVTMLLAERARHGGGLTRDLARTTPTDQLWQTFRGLVNVREPWKPDPAFLAEQDEVLHALTWGDARVPGLVESAGVTQVGAPEMRVSPLDAAGRLLLWRGDITRLAADAIVNAANSRLLGCWQPNHLCIDNAIHTFAGVQLRVACAALTERLAREAGLAEGEPWDEPTGLARVTDAFDLPCRHVIHTVGPIAAGRPSPAQRKQLALCYERCLDAATEAGDRTVAFCSISTGVFGYPIEQAAPVAVRAVRRWLGEHGRAASGMAVVFDVFSARDEHVYEQALGL